METKDIRGLQARICFYETVLDNTRYGVMITDPEGKIM
jgi:hypothetical protein